MEGVLDSAADESDTLSQPGILKSKKSTRDGHRIRLLRGIEATWGKPVQECVPAEMLPRQGDNFRVKARIAEAGHPALDPMKWSLPLLQRLYELSMVVKHLPTAQALLVEEVRKRRNNIGTMNPYCDVIEVLKGDVLNAIAASGHAERIKATKPRTKRPRAARAAAVDGVLAVGRPRKKCTIVSPTSHSTPTNPYTEMAVSGIRVAESGFTSSIDSLVTFDTPGDHNPSQHGPVQAQAPQRLQHLHDEVALHRQLVQFQETMLEQTKAHLELAVQAKEKEKELAVLRLQQAEALLEAEGLLQQEQSEAYCQIQQSRHEKLEFERSEQPNDGWSAYPSPDLDVRHQMPLGSDIKTPKVHHVNVPEPACRSYARGTPGPGYGRLVRGVAMESVVKTEEPDLDEM